MHYQILLLPLNSEVGAPPTKKQIKNLSSIILQRKNFKMTSIKKVTHA